MRTKALVIGAPPRPWEGPWVFLEEGWWLIDPPFHLDSKVEVQSHDGAVTKLMDVTVGLRGPTNVRVRILETFDSPPIHLNARYTREHSTAHQPD